MKVVVTGGAGFIGSHLVDALVKKNYEVHIIDNFIAGRREDRINKNASYHEVDIRDRKKLTSIIADTEFLFHKAALPSVQISIQEPLEAFTVNAQGTANVLDAAQEAGVKRFIFASTCAVYGDQDIMPLTEDMPPRPKTPYALHKYTGELLCRQWYELYGLPTVSFRYLNIYGPRFNLRGAYTAALGKFIMQRNEGKPMTIWGDGNHTRDYTHVSDVVRANLLAMESPNIGVGEVMNIGTGRSVSVNELANLIGGPTVHEEERTESAHVKADIGVAKKLIGYEPEVSLEDGIAELKDLFVSK